MLGIGFIPLLKAIHIMQKRKEHTHTEIGASLYYLLSLPVVYYDFFILGNMQSFPFTLGNGTISILFRNFLFTFGLFLLYKGGLDVVNYFRGERVG